MSATKLTIAALLHFGHQCAPHVAPATLLGHVQVESGRNPYAINVNHAFRVNVIGHRVGQQPKSLAAAVRAANWLEAKGYNFEIGAAHVTPYEHQQSGLSWSELLDPCGQLTRPANTQADAVRVAECLDRHNIRFASGLGQLLNPTVHRFNLSWHDVFDPCGNLEGLDRHLITSYRSEIARGATHRQAVLASYSEYESGDARRGIADGYVRLVQLASANAARQLTHTQVEGTRVQTRTTALPSTTTFSQSRIHYVEYGEQP